jgi:hypothetical protein
LIQIVGNTVSITVVVSIGGGNLLNGSDERLLFWVYQANIFDELVTILFSRYSIYFRSSGKSRAPENFAVAIFRVGMWYTIKLSKNFE